MSINNYRGIHRKTKNKTRDTKQNEPYIEKGKAQSNIAHYNKESFSKCRARVVVMEYGYCYCGLRVILDEWISW